VFIGNIWIVLILIDGIIDLIFFKKIII
jgi:hypothetical protein